MCVYTYILCTQVLTLMTSDGWIVSDWATDANTWSGTGRGRVEVGK